MSSFVLRKLGWMNDEPDSVTRAASAAREQADIARRAESRRICAEAPALVRDFERLLTDHGRHGVIYVAEYAAHLAHSEADLRSGGVPQRITVHGTAARRRTDEWWQSQRATGNQAYALSAVVTEYDATLAPVDTMWRIDVQPAAPVPDGDGDYMDINVQRPLVCEARTAAAGLQHELLVLPLVHEEAALGLRISSIEAVGFSRDNLMRVAERVEQDYYIPLEYQFSGLIARVHACCTMAHLRSRCVTAHGTRPTALWVETVPRALFLLSRTARRYLIAGNHLERAIGFIESRLLRTNAAFDPTATTFSVVPFGPSSWTAAWQAALDRRANAAAVALHEAAAPAAPGVSVRVKVKVHFVLLPPGGLLAIAATPAPAQSPPDDAPAVRASVDDDEIESYESLPE